MSDHARGCQGGVLALAAALALATFPGRLGASDAQLVSPERRGEWHSRAGAERFTRWLAENFDLVFIGRFESWTPRRVAGAGFASIRCRVDSLLSGWSPDTVVTFDRLDKPSFADTSLGPGTRVLGWITRGCGEPGALCGRFEVVTEDGVRLHDYSDSDDAQELASDPRPLRVQDLSASALRAGDPSACFDGARAVAAASFAFDSLLATGDVVLRCLDARWVDGRGAALPTWVRAPVGGDCGWQRPPVRYLLPVPRDFGGDTLEVRCCLNRLRTADGRVPAFGVSLDSLSTVLVRDTAGALRVRRGFPDR